MPVLFDLPVERVEWAMSNGWWTNDTVIDWLDHWAEREPGAVALVAYSEHFDRRTVLTYGDLRRFSLRIGAGLRKFGMQVGDVLSMQLPNWWEALPLVMGAVRIGMIVNPIPPILRRREVAMILSRTQSRIFVVPSMCLKELLNLICTASSTAYVVLGIGLHTSKTCTLLDAATARSPAPSVWPLKSMLLTMEPALYSMLLSKSALFLKTDLCWLVKMFWSPSIASPFTGAPYFFPLIFFLPCMSQSVAWLS